MNQTPDYSFIKTTKHISSPNVKKIVASSKVAGPEIYPTFIIFLCFLLVFFCSAWTFLWEEIKLLIEQISKQKTCLLSCYQRVSEELKRQAWSKCTGVRCHKANSSSREMKGTGAPIGPESFQHMAPGNFLSVLGAHHQQTNKSCCKIFTMRSLTAKRSTTQLNCTT